MCCLKDREGNLEIHITEQTLAFRKEMETGHECEDTDVISFLSAIHVFVVQIFTEHLNHVTHYSQH